VAERTGEIVSGGPSDDAVPTVAPSIREQRLAIVHTRERLTAGLAAIEARIGLTLEGLSAATAPRVRGTGLVGLVESSLGLAIRARRLARMLPLRPPAAIAVVAAGAATLVLLGRRKRPSERDASGASPSSSRPQPTSRPGMD
jgi:hypothetical protein